MGVPQDVATWATGGCGLSRSPVKAARAVDLRVPVADPSALGFVENSQGVSGSSCGIFGRSGEFAVYFRAF